MAYTFLGDKGEVKQALTCVETRPIARWSAPGVP
jgi:hypothetical protein